MRRVTVVASELLGMPGIGGPGTADSLLAVALGRGGHHVDVLVAPGREVTPISPDWEERYAAAGVDVRRLEAVRVRPEFLQPSAAVLAALRADPPDVVVADDWRGLAYAALRARQVGVTLTETAFVVYSHGPARVLSEAAKKLPDTVARFGEEVAQRTCIELADLVVSPSEWLLGWMRHHGWPVPATARVIQNLWESTALGEPAPRAGTGNGVRRLAFFGQLREGKGIRVFVDSLRQLDPTLLEGMELLFLGRETPRWTTERIRQALGPEVSDRVSSIRFESRLERAAALRELLVPGTLAVMPSLLENSPYAVAECIEHGVPFIAAWTGGVPELVAEDDAARVLCPPTAEDFAAALAAWLSSTNGYAPARPARSPEDALAAWLDVVETVLPARPRVVAPATSVAVVADGDDGVGRARRLAESTRSVAVDVIQAESRSAGLEQTAADWVVFLDDEDLPDDGMLDALVTAQAASDADAVTAAVRPADDPGAVRMFLGDPGALGLAENQYGVLGLVRRSAVVGQPPVDGAADPDWLLLARLALAGAAVVSMPEPLSSHGGRPGTAGDVPGDGLAVLEAFEAARVPMPHLPQLTATLAAALARHEAMEQRRDAAPRGRVQRVVRVVRTQGVSGLLRRLLARGNLE